MSPLRQLRLARGLSAETVAQAIGCNGSTVLRMELRQVQSPSLAEKVVEYFGREFITELHVLYPERYAT